jgi:type III secretion protein N (ATPase)
LNHYPATDVPASASRVMKARVLPEHKVAAGRARKSLAKCEEIELLLNVGAYKKGVTRVADQAIDLREALLSDLRQGTHDLCGFDGAIARLRALAGR